MVAIISQLCIICALSFGPAPPRMTDSKLLDEVQHRAVRFFIEEADPDSGLVSNHAHADGSDHPDVASIASTGYGLAAMPIAVEHHWMQRAEAQRRTELTLQFTLNKLQGAHGWYYHFVNPKTGQRTWDSEVSTIDTALLVQGALVAGDYFGGEADALAHRVYDRIDWQWALTNGGAAPDKLLVSHGWKPETGFIAYNWDSYSEGLLIYLLGMKAKNGLSQQSWKAWKRTSYRYGGMEAQAGGPIFLHEMLFGYYNLQGKRDCLGNDYWQSAANGVRMNRLYCLNNPTKRKTYEPDIWGLNAGNVPTGYSANGIPGPEDGTVSPTGALAAIIFMPDEVKRAAQAMYAKYGDRIWRRYGFVNGFNVDANWYDRDVIGIDLGMALLAIENYRTGLIWKHTSLPSSY